MSDLPAGASPDAPAPVQTDPPATAPSRRGLARFLFAPFRFVRNRPGSALALLAVSLLVFAVATVCVGYFWSEYHLAAARQAAEKGHNAEALRHLQSCRLVRADHPEVLFLGASIARRSGNWDESEALLDRYWKLRGDDEALILERLLLRATRGEIEGVRPALQKRIEEGGREGALAREALISGLLYRFRVAETEAEIQKWLERDEENPAALFLLGKFHESHERQSQALEAYRRVLGVDPGHDEARLRLLRILLVMRQGEEALPHAEYLRRRLPDHPEVLASLAQVLILLDRPDEARAAITRCLERHPNHAAALVERGRLAQRDGDGELAEECLHKATRLDPGNGPARYQYYLALQKNGKVEEAARVQEGLRQMEADIERISFLLHGPLQSRPNDPDVPHEIGAIALRAGRPAEALRWLRTALQVDPNHAPTHRLLASIYREMGNPILASRHRAIAQRLGGEGRP